MPSRCIVPGVQQSALLPARPARIHMSDRLGEIDKAVVTVVVSFPKPFF